MQAKDLLMENRLRSTSVWTMQNRKLWFNLIQAGWSRGLAGSLEYETLKSKPPFGSLGSLQRKQFKEFKAKWPRMPREMATEAVLVGVLHRVAQRSSVGLLQMFRQWWLNSTGLWCPCRVTCSQRTKTCHCQSPTTKIPWMPVSCRKGAWVANLIICANVLAFLEGRRSACPCVHHLAQWSLKSRSQPW